MNRVYIDNRQTKIAIDAKTRGLLKRSIGAALKFMKFEYPAEVSVTAVDDGQIRELNRDYRDKDKPTDVLSFPLCENKEWEMSDDGYAILGDIVLSLERCAAQAKEFGHSFEREIAFLTVHSVLHLLGYDHETSKEDEEKMFSLQKQIMEKIKL